MAAVWSIKTLLVDSDNIINDVVWFVTDTYGEYVGSHGGVFKPAEGHPLRNKTYDQFNKQQLIAFVKAGIGGPAVSSAETQAAKNRAAQRKTIANYEPKNWVQPV